MLHAMVRPTVGIPETLGIWLAGVDSTLVPAVSAVSVSVTFSIDLDATCIPYKGSCFMNLDAQLNLHHSTLQTASALRTEGICGGGAARTGGL